MIDQKPAVCKTCLKPLSTFAHLGVCVNCCEVERRLGIYIKSKKGFDFVHAKLIEERFIPVDSERMDDIHMEVDRAEDTKEIEEDLAKQWPKDQA